MRLKLRQIATYNSSLIGLDMSGEIWVLHFGHTEWTKVPGPEVGEETTEFKIKSGEDIMALGHQLMRRD